MKILFRTLAALAILAVPALAADVPPPKVDRFRAYLIYEDTGELSKNLAKVDDQIVANDDKGTSVQMIVDVVLSGKPNQLYESNPVLRVSARSDLDDIGTLVEKDYPLVFFAKDELVRTVVVDHACNGFTIDAAIIDGGNKVSELSKTFSITCGD
ncbi:hypothetical protein [Rhizobium alvei]|uniref:Uncharacterized protein n=1 Tax=Rhizobium alvei TaxID=1132659 RepID=A0ABT8YPS8_9HYPH|nr:hypothetical protein [Rhizobium alvei]MDO6965728.1 hypothetical protein [Rhizobium alvei]